MPAGVTGRPRIVETVVPIPSAAATPPEPEPEPEPWRPQSSITRSEGRLTNIPGYCRPETAPVSGSQLVLSAAAQSRPDISVSESQMTLTGE